uniref:Protein SSUH2 homolog n=1 Tax=Panagrolaimus superbus TaxID=310955 RepID=A0A914YYX3_9BILA
MHSWASTSSLEIDLEAFELFEQFFADATIKDRKFENVEEINETDLRNALLVEAKRRKCFGTKAINKMIFENVEHSCCYHYVLESFTETRSTADGSEAYTIGQYVENHGDPLALQIGASTSGNSSLYNTNPWDYDVPPDEDFKVSTKVFELPGSTRLNGCTLCNADGVTHCFHCRGYGNDKCSYCRGTGMKAGVAHPAVYTHPMVGAFPHVRCFLFVNLIKFFLFLKSDTSRGYPGTGVAMMRPSLSNRQSYAVGTPVHFMVKAGLPPPGIGHYDLCLFCQGRGVRECHHCKGNGKKTCNTCGGHGSVRTFVKLKIFFTVEHSEYYTQAEVPERLLRTATGNVIFQETQPYVLPLKKFQVKDINEISRKFCAQHLQKSLGACRVIKQRHYVEAFPVAKVSYRMDSRVGVFYVFGKERLCYIPKSPSKCSVM